MANDDSIATAVHAITPKVIEGLFASDLAYLQDVYGAINFGDPAELPEAGVPLPESPQADGG